MAELINKFNEGGTTSSSIDRQFTPEFVSRSVVEIQPRKRPFTQMGSKIGMPKHRGDKITKEIRLPMLHRDNMVDGGLDASTATLIKGMFYVYDAAGTLDSTYNALDYTTAGVQDFTVVGTPDTNSDVYTDYLAAVALAEAAAVARVGVLGAGAKYKSGAGSIMNGDAAYAISKGPLAVLPEEGGVVNLLNSSSKLVTAKLTFHGIGTKYTVRSANLDSRIGQVATKIKELSRATYEIKEMQVQNSILSASEQNRIVGSTTAVSLSGMKALDVITYDALTAFELELQRNDVPMDTEILSGTTKIDTKVIEDGYICFINRELVPGLRKVKGPDGVTIAWIPKSQYAAGTTLIDGEAGSIGSFRFVVVPDLQVYRGAGYSAAQDVTDTTATAAEAANRYQTNGMYDVFPMIVVGEDSFLTTSFAEGSVTARHISPKADVHNDMHAQVGGVASNWEYGFLAYRPERIRQLVVVGTRV